MECCWLSRNDRRLGKSVGQKYLIGKKVPLQGRGRWHSEAPAMGRTKNNFGKTEKKLSEPQKQWSSCTTRIPSAPSRFCRRRRSFPPPTSRSLGGTPGGQSAPRRWLSLPPLAYADQRDAGCKVRDGKVELIAHLAKLQGHPTLTSRPNRKRVRRYPPRTRGLATKNVSLE